MFVPGCFRLLLVDCHYWVYLVNIAHWLFGWKIFVGCHMFLVVLWHQPIEAGSFSVCTHCRLWSSLVRGQESTMWNMSPQWNTLCLSDPISFDTCHRVRKQFIHCHGEGGNGAVKRQWNLETQRNSTVPVEYRRRNLVREKLVGVCFGCILCQRLYCRRCCALCSF